MPNGTYGGVRGWGLAAPAYSIIEHCANYMCIVVICGNDVDQRFALSMHMTIWNLKEVEC